MAKRITLVLGVVLTLVGLLGFFNNPVVGIFNTNALHNIVHLATGVLAIVFAMQSEASAIMFNKVFGVIYALVTILGFVTPGFMTDLLNINMMDNILHLVLAVIFLYVGFAMKPSASSMQTM